jgi:TP901 family phage tail tape measure protein
MAKISVAFEKLKQQAETSGVAVAASVDRMKSGLKLFGLGAAGMGALVLPAQTYQDFGKAMAEVSTLVDTSKVDMGALTSQVERMSVAFGADHADQARALYQTISSGFSDATQATVVLNAANKMAVAGVTDTTTSVNGLTAVLNAYGMRASQATEVSDVMFTAVAGGKTTIAELSAYLFQAAPGAAALGVQFEQLMGASVALTMTGMPTSVAMTRIRAAMDALIRPSKEMTDVWQRAGYESGRAAIRAIGFQGAIGAVYDAAGGDPGKLERLLGSSEAVGAALVLGGKGAQTFRAQVEAMGRASGATEVAFRKMLPWLEGAIDKAKIKQFLIDIGRIAKPLIGMLLAPFRLLLDLLLAIPEPVKKVGTYLLWGASAALMLNGAFRMAHGAMGLFRMALPLISQQLAAAKGNVLGLARAMLTSPWGIAAAALTAAWVLNLGGIQDKLKKWWANTKLVVEGVVALFTSEQDGVGTIPAAIHDSLEKAGLLKMTIMIWQWAERIRTMGESAWASIKEIGSSIAYVWNIVNGVLIRFFGPADEAKKKTDDMNVGIGFSTEQAKKWGDILGKVAVAWGAIKIATIAVQFVQSIYHGIMIVGTGLKWLAVRAANAHALALGRETAAQVALNAAGRARAKDFLTGGKGLLGGASAAGGATSLGGALSAGGLAGVALPLIAAAGYGSAVGYGIRKVFNTDELLAGRSGLLAKMGGYKTGPTSGRGEIVMSGTEWIRSMMLDLTSGERARVAQQTGSSAADMRSLVAALQGHKTEVVVQIDRDVIVRAAVEGMQAAAVRTG